MWMFSVFPAPADLISSGWRVSVLPDGLQISAGLKITYVISGHTVLELQINYICFYENVICF